MVAYLTDESNNVIQTLFKLWNSWNLLVKYLEIWYHAINISKLEIEKCKVSFNY
jgi:hypothetical protein